MSPAIITHQPPPKDSAAAEGLVTGPWTLWGGAWMHGDHPIAALGYMVPSNNYPNFHPITKKCSPLGEKFSLQWEIRLLCLMQRHRESRELF